MANLKDIAETIDEQGKAIDTFVGSYKGAVEDLVDRVEELESRGSRPGKVSESSQGFKAFDKFVRKGEPLEGKAVTVGSDPGGGYLVPEDLSRRITDQVQNLSILRPLVTVEQATSLSSFNKLVGLRGTTSGWIDEGGTRSETSTPQFAQVTPTHGELYAVAKLSWWAIEDAIFDVTNYVLGHIAQEFALQEGAAIVNGSGTNRPTGFLQGPTPVTTGDDDSPARAFGTLQYIATGVDGGFPNSPFDSPPGDPVAVLYDTAFALRAGYRQNARWLMNSSTLATIAKWRDADGRNVWQPDLSRGTAGSLIGWPVSIVEDMPAIASGSFSIAFGDWTRGYLLADGVGTRIIRDEVTSRGHVQFYARRRLGGKILDSNAVKLVKFATS